MKQAQDFYNSNFSILKDEIDKDFVNILLSKFDRKANSEIKEEKSDNDNGKFEKKNINQIIFKDEDKH